LGTVFIGMGMVFTYVRILLLEYQRADRSFC
jgi:hypothetical protein